MSPLDVPPRHPWWLARYGVTGIQPATPRRAALRHRRTRRAAQRYGRALDALVAVAGNGRLRTVSRHAGAPRGMADGPRRLGGDRRRARVDRRGSRRHDRVQPPSHLAAGSSCDAPPCSISPRGRCWPSTTAGSRALSPHAHALSLRTGSVQDRLGARRPRAVDESRDPARRDRAPRRHRGRDRRRRARRATRPPSRAPVHAVLAADAVRSEPRPGGPAHRVGLLPCAARLDRRHDRRDRSAGRAVRTRLSRPHPRATSWGPRRWSPTTPTTSGATSTAGSPTSGSSSRALDCRCTPGRHRLRVCTSVRRRRRPAAECTACAVGKPRVWHCTGSAERTAAIARSVLL